VIVILAIPAHKMISENWLTTNVFVKTDFSTMGVQNFAKCVQPHAKHAVLLKVIVNLVIKHLTAMIIQSICMSVPAKWAISKMEMQLFATVLKNFF
jgi:hypothetical protein